MFRKIIKKLLPGILLRPKKSKKEQDLLLHIESGKTRLSRNLQDNINLFQNILGHSSDFVVREFSFGVGKNYRAALFFIDVLIDKKIINNSIIRPLMYDFNLISPEQLKESKTLDFLANRMLSVDEIKKTDQIDSLLNACLYGDTVFLMDGFAEGLIIGSKGWQIRNIKEPETEVVVRGPREGFVESVNVNISLLRRKIRHPDLVIERMQIGEKTRTLIAIAYVKQIVRPGVVEEVRKRLQRINTDAILESGYIEQFIEDAPYSLFSTVGNSEKPDVVAMKILEGRVAIFVDGTPIVLTVPLLFIEGFQSAEDYYLRPYYVFFVRLLRLLCFFISLLAPPVYVALTSYHQELIPTPLLFTIAAVREGAPFPVAIEILLIGIFFEIVREAGIRLPRPIGGAISIVGALVIGDAAVSAGLIGAPIIIVIAITALATFVVTTLYDILLLYRLVLIFGAATLGGFGIVTLLILLTIHLASLRSFGVPYLAPLAPLNVSELKDSFVRFPLWAMWNRPQDLSYKNQQRQRLGQMPRPPRKRFP
ncbi:MAG: spore germination protein [Clostridia bacterium]|jgi:spore germination protein KA|nr:spore germination protein [Clostridia bacterium]